MVPGLENKVDENACNALRSLSLYWMTLASRVHYICYYHSPRIALECGKKNGESVFENEEYYEWLIARLPFLFVMV